ncbi:TetR/AcrR family transcriptional regulator [Pantoea sp. LMR881]|uniref:TetR/AcrR family transcriptional regulator n=1 Tax=Pantoea sp. LMR881 TaxID=3014336 RepID=UPI0022AFB26B|nr:TetR/AcrR family transcriptional regulator [Pantoea sp. LMR881]MCZ4061055.1 TetR/AcrR family transcriptional regulator [Pantoea sp. LMR881]
MSKRAERAAHTQATLRKAAIRVFARKGFHDTKISDIVAEAGVSQPTFYLYHDSKELLFETLVSEFRHELREATRQCLISPGLDPDDLSEDLRQSFMRFLTVLCRERDLTEMGFYQTFSGEATKAQMLEWIALNMEREQQAGILRGDIPVRYQARLVLGMLDQMSRIAEREQDLEELAGVCSKLFCDALAAKH